MSTFIFIIGLALGISGFLYILSLYDSGKRKIKKISGKITEKPKQEISPESISFKDYHPPGSRICPLCRSSLTKYEALYASKIETVKESKIFIHGCRYCYKSDEDPEKQKKSSF